MSQPRSPGAGSGAGSQCQLNRAAIILPVGFAMSHGSHVVDAAGYPTAPMHGSAQGD